MKDIERRLIKQGTRARPGKGGPMKLVWRKYYKVSYKGEDIYLIKKAYANNSDGDIRISRIVKETFNRAVKTNKEVIICDFEDADMGAKGYIEKLVYEGQI